MSLAIIIRGALLHTNLIASDNILGSFLAKSYNRVYLLLDRCFISCYLLCEIKVTALSELNNKTVVGGLFDFSNVLLMDWLL